MNERAAKRREKKRTQQKQENPSKMEYFSYYFHLCHCLMVCFPSNCRMMASNTRREANCFTKMEHHSVLRKKCNLKPSIFCFNTTDSYLFYFLCHFFPFFRSLLLFVCISILPVAFFFLSFFL